MGVANKRAAISWNEVKSQFSIDRIRLENEVES